VKVAGHKTRMLGNSFRGNFLVDDQEKLEFPLKDYFMKWFV
jgi:hypothetical protein